MPVKTTDGRRNNKGVTKPEGEKRTYLKIRVKKKNHDEIKAKVMPIVKSLDD